MTTIGRNNRENQVRSLFWPGKYFFRIRRWIIVKSGRPETQRQLSRMALIRPSFTAAGLTLDAPNMPTLTVSTDPLPKEIVDYGYA